MKLFLVLHWLVRRTGVPVARISALGPTPHRDRHGRGRQVCHVWSCATRIDKRRIAAIEPAVEHALETATVRALEATPAQAVTI